jgi:2-iminobutanoate/2-iminopropanoate deaminase
VINRVPNHRIRDAARRVFGEAARDGREMAFAVADEAAGLVFAARTEGCAARVLTHAIRKAYTAATMQRDTVAFRDGDRQAGKTLADWGDPQLTHLVGGAVLWRDGELWGGVGVGGNTTERDGELSLLARDLLLQGVSQPHHGSRPDVADFGDTLAYAARQDLFALTGVTGADPRTGRIPEAPEAEFAQAFANVSALAERLGFGLDEVGRITVFTPDPSNRPLINPGWLDLFPGDNRPARKTTHIPLRKGRRVELEVAGARGTREAIEIEGVRHKDPLPMGARVGRHVFSSVIGSDIPGSGGSRPGRAGAIGQAFANMASFAEAAGGTLDEIANVWAYLGLWDLHPDYVDTWVTTFADGASRPSRKTFYYPRTDIQLQCEMVIGGKRSTLEIPGIGHQDPIPMGVVTGGVFTSSGVDGRNPETGKPPRGVRAQAEMTLQNLQRLLDQASLPRSALVHVTGLVGEQSYADELAAAWKDMFADQAAAPAFQLMELGLPARDLLVQVIARGVAG